MVVYVCLAFFLENCNWKMPKILSHKPISRLDPEFQLFSQALKNQMWAE